jgi:hypothetical protein
MMMGWTKTNQTKALHRIQGKANLPILLCGDSY